MYFLIDCGVDRDVGENKDQYKRKVEVALRMLADVGYPSAMIEALRVEQRFSGSIVSILDGDLVKCTLILQKVANGNTDADGVIAWARDEHLRGTYLNCVVEEKNERRKWEKEVWFNARRRLTLTRYDEER